MHKKNFVFFLHSPICLREKQHHKVLVLRHQSKAKCWLIDCHKSLRNCTDFCGWQACRFGIDTRNNHTPTDNNINYITRLYFYFFGCEHFLLFPTTRYFILSRSGKMASLYCIDGHVHNEMKSSGANHGESRGVSKHWETGRLAPVHKTNHRYHILYKLGAA